MALYGVYGSHTVEACPVNNLEVAKKVVSFGESDSTPLLSSIELTTSLASITRPLNIRSFGSLMQMTRI